MLSSNTNGAVYDDNSSEKLISDLKLRLGWGISGACAAPVFVILGFKWLPALIILLGALIGAFVYGLLSNRLPN